MNSGKIISRVRHLPSENILGFDSMHHQYGRRIEADRTWTIYSVFSGVPAVIGGVLMTHLSGENATASMLWLNVTNATRRAIANRQRNFSAQKPL